MFNIKVVKNETLFTKGLKIVRNVTFAGLTLFHTVNCKEKLEPQKPISGSNPKIEWTYLSIGENDSKTIKFESQSDKIYLLFIQQKNKNVFVPFANGNYPERDGNAFMMGGKMYVNVYRPNGQQALNEFKKYHSLTEEFGGVVPIYGVKNINADAEVILQIPGEVAVAVVEASEAQRDEAMRIRPEINDLLNAEVESAFNLLKDPLKTEEDYRLATLVLKKHFNDDLGLPGSHGDKYILNRNFLNAFEEILKINPLPNVHIAIAQELLGHTKNYIKNPFQKSVYQTLGNVLFDDLLAETSSYKKEELLKLFAETNHPERSSVLKKIFEDKLEDSAVRSQAINLLVKNIKTLESAKLAMEQIKLEKSVASQPELCFALAEYDLPEVTDFLEAMAKDSSKPYWVQMNCLNALRSNDYKSVLPNLLRIYKESKNPQVAAKARENYLSDVSTFYFQRRKSIQGRYLKQLINNP